MLSDESHESDEEEYEKIGCESRSAGTFGTVMSWSFHGVGFPLGVTLYYDDSCDCDWGLLVP